MRVKLKLSKRGDIATFAKKQGKIAAISLESLFLRVVLLCDTRGDILSLSYSVLVYKYLYNKVFNSIVL